MNTDRTKIAIGLFAGIWLIAGLAAGLIPQHSATDAGPFADGPLHCGSPWFPNYAGLASDGVAQCSAQTLPSAILASAFILGGVVSLLVFLAYRAASEHPA